MKREMAPSAAVRSGSGDIGLLAGARAAAPLAISGVAYGVVFGILAGQAGLSLLETVLMSSLVNAGTSQFIAVDLWQTPVPTVTVVLSTLVVNARLLLMGATLRPLLRHMPARRAYPTLFFLSDETWALTMREQAAGRLRWGFLLGAGLALYPAWIGSTLIGRTGGAAIADPARWGLDVAFTAVFAALLIGFWRGRASAPAWIVAGGVAAIADRVLPGTWYILLGALTGGLVGVFSSGGSKLDER